MTAPPDPSTIVATIPRWLGRPPRCGETILVGLSPMDEEHLVILALDPNREATDEVAAMRQLVIDGAEQVAIVEYTGSEDPPPSLLEATLRFLAAAAARYGLDVLGVLVVVVRQQRDRAGYWRQLGDDSSTAIRPLPTPTRTEETP